MLWKKPHPNDFRQVVLISHIMKAAATQYQTIGLPHIRPSACVPGEGGSGRCYPLPAPSVSLISGQGL